MIRPALTVGGSPSSLGKTLELAKELLSVSVPHTYSGEGGQFELNAPRNHGDYNVTVFSPGYIASEAASISTSSDSNNVDIHLQPSAIISGRVTDEQGKPISGIVVAAESPHSANYDVTMDDGVFVLDTSLKTGLHKIYTFKPGIDTTRLHNLLNNTELGMLLQSKFPSFFKIQNEGYTMYSTAIEVEQGKLTTLNIQLKSSQIISGTVQDANGNPIPDVAVFAFNSNGTMANTAAITDSNGKYTLNNDLSARTYTVIIPALFSKGYAPASTSVQVPVTGGINFVLHKSSIISGKVVNAKGDPVRNATVFAISKSLNSDNTELAQFLAAGAASTKTDDQGMFTMNRGIDKGTYIVTAAFGNAPVSNSIEVQAGEGESIANITLNFIDTIRASGKVVDSGGKPIENALLVPSFASAIPGTELFAARTNLDGAFSLTIPLQKNNNNSTKSLFSEISVSADGYNTTTVQAQPTDTIVKMQKAPFIQVSGRVIAEKSISPPIEAVLTRKGTIIFDHQGAKYSVGLQTNLRVLDASFDSENKRITIKLEGAQGGAGSSEFVISKEFLAGPFIVNLDGNAVQPDSVKVSENETYSTIKLEHDHGLQEIMIQGTTAIPEFPFPAAIVAVVLAAPLVLRRFHYRFFYR